MDKDCCPLTLKINDMKKTLSILFLMVFMGLGFASKAQDLQVMYDFGGERQYITTTFEMYKADKWGGTFSSLISIMMEKMLLIIMV